MSQQTVNVEPLAYSDRHDSLVVKALCHDLLRRGINFNISTADEMLHFFLYAQGHDLEQAVAMYLESGRRIWMTEAQILSWWFGSLSWGGPLLDFASGYGRVTRHIVGDIEKERVWVSDIYAGGVAFQEREMGVHGIVSATIPEDFRCDQRFDAILVSSLFTHLPESRFIGWLHRLGSLLNPGGVLLFSVHDLSLYKEALPDPPVGMVFREISESGSLDTRDYGSSWVTEEFVRSAVEAAVGAYPVLRVPRGLASFQDLYVVLKDDSAKAPEVFSDLELKRDADGFLEHCSWTGRRSLHLSGWLADRVTGRPPRDVRVSIDGKIVGSCEDLQPRPALNSAFASDPVDVFGWRITVDLSETSSPESADLSVWGTSSRGEALSLYSGPVSWACLRSAQLDIVMLRGQLNQETVRGERLEQQKNLYESRLAEDADRMKALDQRIRGMEASRFWRARNVWFRLKRALGITEEP